MKKNNKGFTLAELLIVVAIIAVLVAIAIPVFTSQLEKAREATDMANIRSGYGAAVVDYLANGDASAIKVEIEAKQTLPGWEKGTNSTLSTDIGSFAKKIEVTASTTGWEITLESDGTVNVTAK